MQWGKMEYYLMDKTGTWPNLWKSRSKQTPFEFVEKTSQQKDDFSIVITKYNVVKSLMFVSCGKWFVCDPLWHSVHLSASYVGTLYSWNVLFGKPKIKECARIHFFWFDWQRMQSDPRTRLFVKTILYGISLHWFSLRSKTIAVSLKRLIFCMKCLKK